jgi:hypothetical protein
MKPPSTFVEIYTVTIDGAEIASGLELESARTLYESASGNCKSRRLFRPLPAGLPCLRMNWQRLWLD